MTSLDTARAYLSGTADSAEEKRDEVLDAFSHLNAEIGRIEDTLGRMSDEDIDTVYKIAASDPDKDDVYRLFDRIDAQRELAGENPYFDNLSDERREELAEAIASDPDRRGFMKGLAVGGATAVLGAGAYAAGSDGGNTNPQGGEVLFEDIEAFETAVDQTRYKPVDFIPDHTWKEYKDKSEILNGKDPQRPAPNEPFRLSYNPGNAESAIELTEEVFDTGDNEYDEQALRFEIGDDPAQALYKRATVLASNENIEIKEGIEGPQ